MLPRLWGAARAPPRPNPFQKDVRPPHNFSPQPSRVLPTIPGTRCSASSPAFCAPRVGAGWLDVSCLAQPGPTGPCRPRPAQAGPGQSRRLPRRLAALPFPSVPAAWPLSPFPSSHPTVLRLACRRLYAMQPSSREGDKGVRGREAGWGGSVTGGGGGVAGVGLSAQGAQAARAAQSPATPAAAPARCPPQLAARPLPPFAPCAEMGRIFLVPVDNSDVRDPLGEAPGRPRDSADRRPSTPHVHVRARGAPTDAAPRGNKRCRSRVCATSPPPPSSPPARPTHC